MHCCSRVVCEHAFRAGTEGWQHAQGQGCCRSSASDHVTPRSWLRMCVMAMLGTAGLPPPRDGSGMVRDHAESCRYIGPPGLVGRVSDTCWAAGSFCTTSWWHGRGIWCLLWIQRALGRSKPPSGGSPRASPTNTTAPAHPMAARSGTADAACAGLRAQLRRCRPGGIPGRLQILGGRSRPAAPPLHPGHLAATPSQLTGAAPALVLRVCERSTGCLQVQGGARSQDQPFTRLQ